MNIAVFGGTFDPPHCSHMATVLWLLQHPEVDRVVVVPTAHHPFGKEPAAAFRHRVEMCRLAVSRFAQGLVEVSGIEGEREKPSYTIDTVREFMRLNPEARFRVAMGSDIVGDLPKWHEGDELVRIAPPLEVPRITAEHSARTGAIPMLSSTDIRERLAGGGNVTGLIPARVVEYISQHNLYR